MSNLRELNLKLTEKIKNIEDVQTFKRPAPKLSIFNASEIEFSTPTSKFSKKSKPNSDRPVLMRRQERKLSTDSDFSFDDASNVTVSFYCFIF